MRHSYLAIRCKLTLGDAKLKRQTHDCTSGGLRIKALSLPELELGKEKRYRLSMLHFHGYRLVGGIAEPGIAFDWVKSSEIL